MHCGADIYEDATFCRECGASDDSGWDHDTTDAMAYGGYSDDEDDQYDYESFVAREFPDYVANKDFSARRLLMALCIIAVCIALGFGFLF